MSLKQTILEEYYKSCRMPWERIPCHFGKYTKWKRWRPTVKWKCPMPGGVSAMNGSLHFCERAETTKISSLASLWMKQSIKARALTKFSTQEATNRVSTGSAGMPRRCIRHHFWLRRWANGRGWWDLESQIQPWPPDYWYALKRERDFLRSCNTAEYRHPDLFPKMWRANPKPFFLTFKKFKKVHITT